jgi:hypothetical protein
MLETVKPINQYTGERADGGMMADGGHIDMEDLRSEYESTYLAYVKSDDYMSFEEWLEKKGI